MLSETHLLLVSNMTDQQGRLQGSTSERAQRPSLCRMRSGGRYRAAKGGRRQVLPLCLSGIGFRICRAESTERLTYRPVP
jgi:hypothetical protein